MPYCTKRLLRFWGSAFRPSNRPSASWWLAVFPGLALVAVVLLFDMAGSSLRTLADPHTSQE